MSDVQNEELMGVNNNFNENNSMQSTKKPQPKAIKILTIIGVYLVLALGIISMGFDVVTNMIWGMSEVFSIMTFLFSATMFLLTIPLFIAFPLSKHKVNIAISILLLIYALFAIATMIFSILAWSSSYTIFTNTYLSSYYERYITTTTYYYGSAWMYWVILGINCAITLFTSFTLILNISTKNKYSQEERKATKPVVNTMNLIKEQPQKQVVNNITYENDEVDLLEKELKKVQKLLDDDLINKEEYEVIKKSIINKFYN